MIIEFSESITTQEQQVIKVWITNNKLQSSRIVKINGADYNLVVAF